MGIWVFGYGSLIFKPPLHETIGPNLTRFSGHVDGFIRRFWQSSSDHRGTPEFKGRVATIIPVSYLDSKSHDSVNQHERLNDPESQLCVTGCLYYIPPEHAKEAREYLDIREQDGYTLQQVNFVVDSDKEHPLLQKFPKDVNGNPLVPCTVYVGDPEHPNESYIGPELLEDTASIIAHAVGPSGANIDYLRMLHDSAPPDSYLTALLDAANREIKSTPHL